MLGADNRTIDHGGDGEAVIRQAAEVETGAPDLRLGGILRLGEHGSELISRGHSDRCSGSCASAYLAPVDSPISAAIPSYNFSQTMGRYVSAHFVSRILQTTAEPTSARGTLTAPNDMAREAAIATGGRYRMR
jgi:hypothetical protein